MLRNIFTIVGVICLTTLIVPTLTHCPKDCNCTDTSLARCESLNFDNFDGQEIFILSITHPKHPLSFKNHPFDVPGLNHLNSISINNATIPEIQKHAFKGLPYLMTLVILNSDIPKINDSLTFSGATKLSILTITNSTLTTFENVKSMSLRELNLSGCKLTSITKTNFMNLPYLTYLNVAGNNINRVNDLAFSKLLDLQVLILSDNYISSLNSDMFVNNNELVTLDLTNNPIKIIDFKLDSGLEKLVLKSTNLNHFTDKFSNQLTLLNYLDLSNINVEFSKNAFVQMIELEYIDLSNNSLSSLDPKIFYWNSRLQKVILDNNNFTSMPKLICKQKAFEIYFLSCKNCSLQFLSPNSFKYIPALIILNLSHNHLNGSSLSAVQHTPSLIELDLSYNKITTVHPSSFSKLSALSKLIMSGNPLLSLDSSLFHNNKVLKFLDVSFCNLHRIWKPRPKVQIRSLIQLNVAHNLIKSLTDLDITPSLQVLDVSNNSLQCDEYLRDAITWLTKHEVSPASATPRWRTHEPIGSMLNITFDKPNKESSWKHLALENCNTGDKDKLINGVLTNKKEEHLLSEDEEYNDDEYYIETDDEEFFISDKTYIKNNSIVRELINEVNKDATRFGKRSNQIFTYVWPFILFLLIVVCSSVIFTYLILMLFKVKIAIHKVKRPYIKIPQWNSSNRMNIHSYSVYQPLSEDKSESFSNLASENQTVPVHYNLLNHK